MKPKKDRLAVTLTDSQSQIFTRMAEIRGVPRSKILKEYIDEIEPVMARILSMLERVQKSDQKALERLKGTVEAKEIEINTIMQDALNQLDIFNDEIAAN